MTNGYQTRDRRGLSAARFGLGFFLLAGGAGAALAQSATTPTAPVTVVSATRLVTPLEQVASSVTVIGAEEIDRNQYRTLPEALQTVPGLNVVQLGPTGTLTSVFVRGSESNHVLVLLDGIALNDPSAPDGAYDFSSVLLDDVERIEVLRGSQSTLYGSDAIGGVVNIVTKRGEGAFSARGRLEGGSHATFNQAANVGGMLGRVDYWLGVQHFDTNGETVTPDRLRPAGAPKEDDGYENVTASGRLGVQATDALRFNFVGRYVDTRIEIDTNPEDPNAVDRTDQLFGRAEAEFGLFDGVFNNRAGISYTYYDRMSEDPPDFLSPTFALSEFMGDRLKLDWQGDVIVGSDHTLTFGLETEQESVDSMSTFSSGFVSVTDADVRNNAAFTQLQASVADRFFATAGVRVDDHEFFGEHVTWRVAPTYLHRETNTKLKGSVGTGFKAPTLEQLFGASFFPPFGQIFSGNPNLKPEQSFAVDAGFEQEFADGRLAFGATAFLIEIDDLIDFNSTFSSLINIDEVRNRGAEMFLTVWPCSFLVVRGDYTYLYTEDLTTGQELLRRPRHKASASVTYKILENADVTATVLHIGARQDIDAVTFARKKVPGYTVVNVAGSYRIGRHWRIFGRVNNVLDKTYEPADGFRGPGIAGFVGFEAVL